MNTKEQFELLRTNGNIGFYTHCEIVQIFGYKKDVDGAFNIYTLVIFQDKSFKESEPKYLTDKPIPITTDISCGIQKAILSIDNAILFFENLFTKKKFHLGNNSECNIGSLKFLNKLFVAGSDSNPFPQLNYILKNNFHNGSYIIEAFDCNKEYVSFLLEDPVKLNEISEKINEKIPLKIANVSDRLGNIIFQFPINNFKVEIWPLDKRISLHFYLHDKYQFPDSLFAIAKNKVDDCIVDFNTKQLTHIQDSIIIDNSDPVELTIINKNTNLILFHDEVSYIDNVSVNCTQISYLKRCFRINNESYQLDFGTF